MDGTQKTAALAISRAIDIWVADDITPACTTGGAITAAWIRRISSKADSATVPATASRWRSHRVRATADRSCPVRGRSSTWPADAAYILEIGYTGDPLLRWPAACFGKWRVHGGIRTLDTRCGSSLRRAGFSHSPTSRISQIRHRQLRGARYNHGIPPHQWEFCASSKGAGRAPPDPQTVALRRISGFGSLPFHCRTGAQKFFSRRSCLRQRRRHRWIDDHIHASGRGSDWCSPHSGWSPRPLSAQVETIDPNSAIDGDLVEQPGDQPVYGEPAATPTPVPSYTPTPEATATGVPIPNSRNGPKNPPRKPRMATRSTAAAVDDPRRPIAKTT